MSEFGIKDYHLCIMLALHMISWVVLALHVIATNRVRRTCLITMGTLKHEFHFADTPTLTIIISQIPIFSCHGNCTCLFLSCSYRKILQKIMHRFTPRGLGCADGGAHFRSKNVGLPKSLDYKKIILWSVLSGEGLGCAAGW